MKGPLFFKQTTIRVTLGFLCVIYAIKVKEHGPQFDDMEPHFDHMEPHFDPLEPHFDPMIL